MDTDWKAVGGGFLVALLVGLLGGIVLPGIGALGGGVVGGFVAGWMAGDTIGRSDRSSAGARSSSAS